MIEKNKINQLTWWHITRPTENDLAEVAKAIHPHHLIMEELTATSDRSKVEVYDDYVYLVYHLPIWNTKERTSRRGEIDIVATKTTVVSVAYENLEPLEQFRNDLHTKLAGKIQNPPELIHYLLQEVNIFSLRELRHIEEKTNAVGRKIFKRADSSLLEEISYIKRDLLDFGIITASQKTTLESLIDVGATFWGNDARIYFTDLLGSLLRVHYLLENLRATIVSYSETVSQIFQFKTSEVIRRFSILGFLTFPLLLYATIALQPTVAPTFIQNPFEFWMIFGTICVIVIVLAMFFRKKGWF
jgi:magnesium transporter